MSGFLVIIALLLGGHGIVFWLLITRAHPSPMGVAMWGCGLLILGTGIGWMFAAHARFDSSEASPPPKEVCRAMDV
jgi:hypothetical protein